MSTPSHSHGDGNARKVVAIGEQNVYGPVQFNVVDGAEQGAVLQKPPRNLPQRQEKFAGRESELRSLHDRLTQEALVGVTQQAAVHSHGGVGKTSLAVEYGWRHLDNYPGGVFFLSCERAPVPPLAELAPYLGIRHTNNAETTAMLVKQRLEAGDPSLLILDNVQDQAQWREGKWNQLLPQSPCRRLVTTRVTQLGGVRMVPLERLSTRDGMQLLANFRGDADEDAGSATAIVEWFDGLAVGLTVVGIYMQMNPGLSWRQYADDLQRRGLVVVGDTEEMVEDALEYEGRAGSVFNDVLGALSAAERRALEFAALLPEDNVFAPWLVELLHNDGVEIPLRPGYLDAPSQHVVNSLVSRQLLRPRGEDERVLGLHRVLRQHLAEQISSTKKEPLLQAIETLANRRGPASRDVLTDAALHTELTALAALSETLNVVGRSAAAVSTTNWIAESLRLMGRYSEARALVESFAPVLDTVEPIEAGTLLMNFASLLHEHGELMEARYRVEQAIEILKENLEADDPRLGSGYSNLAVILLDQGAVSEARTRIDQAIEIQEQHWGADDPRLAITYSNLALILQAEGELEEARHYMQRVIVIQEHQLGPSHPRLAVSYSNLAMIFFDMKDLPAARTYLEKAIEIDERHLRSDHPNLAVRYNNLGGVELASGDMVRAYKLFSHAEAILSAYFPPEHPHRKDLRVKLEMLGTD